MSESPAPAPEALAVTPVRTAAWSEVGSEEGGSEEGSEEGGEEREPRVVVERPLPPVRGLGSLLRRISALTGVRRLRLDARGSFAWRRFDGATSVGEVAAALHREMDRKRDGERDREGEPEEAEARLVTFVALLRKEGLVGLPGLDDRRIAEWRVRSEGPGNGGAGNPRS